MSRLGHTELVAALRREGEAIVAAGRSEPQAAVTTCGDWRMVDLLRHVGSAFARAARVVEERASAPAPAPELPAGDDDAAAFCAEALDELVESLTAADADTQAWNWTGQDQTAGFWARRMAHEAAVHRYDAQRAVGVAQPLDSDLAADGLDELLDVIQPFLVEHRSITLAPVAITLSATDVEDWHLEVDGTSRRVDLVREPDVTARGTASALLLATLNRVPWTSLEVTGDQAALAAWSAALSF